MNENSKELEAIDKLHKEFIWYGQGGAYRLSEMVDRHLVYSMRMLYNHYLTRCGLNKVPGGIQYSEIRTMKNAKQALRTILIFMYEVETNRQLKGKYLFLYEEMKENILEKAGVAMKKQNDIDVCFLLEREAKQKCQSH